MRRWLTLCLEAFNRLRLPSASVLPVAGAVVGLYSGLAAGIFSNLIGVLSGLVFGWQRFLHRFHAGAPVPADVARALRDAPWHTELAIIWVPLALAALGVSRFIAPGGAREVVKSRLRILALLTLAALALYYPLVALAALNSVLGHPQNIGAAVANLPFWAKLLVPSLGGLVVGRLLKDRPEIHGHGVPEVVLAVKNERGELSIRGGLFKLLASAVTIGSGGSAGREGPIVFGGAALAAGVGKTLGFRRKELSILLAAGAGAGIAASFNAPIAGAIFALEIILREFELKVFSPIILASVTATMVARGTVGSDAMLGHLPYQMKSGREIVGYVALGLLCGTLAFTFIQLLHLIHGLFLGEHPGRVSAFLKRRPLPARVALGGFLTGTLLFLSPVAWGSGHEVANLAAEQKLAFGALAVGCLVKLLATALTLGSGGSGGTFFPATVIGAMGGGALGVVMNHLLPGYAAPSGAYAVVGMGGCVAALTRGPLTGMIMIYELSRSNEIILPLMVTCTIASAFCHALVERRDRARTAASARATASLPVRDAMVACRAVLPHQVLSQVLPALLHAGGALPVVGPTGAVEGVVQQEDLSDLWSEENLLRSLVVADVERKVEGVHPETTFEEALARMQSADVRALPVMGSEDAVRGLAAIVTRAAIQRAQERFQHGEPDPQALPLSPTELTDAQLRT